MTIIANIKRDIKAAKKLRLPWWVILCLMAVTFFSAWFLDSLGRLELTLPILNSIGVVGFVIAVKWDSRWRPWFWIAMAFVATLLTCLIWFTPWTSKWVPAGVIATIDSLGICAVLAFIDVFQQFADASRNRTTVR